MKNFISIDDISDFNSLIDESISIKKNPFKYSHLGEKKAIGLIFFNKSLRTRLSMQKAAEMIGLKCFVMNFNNEGWNLEFENNAIMSTDKAEHIKEAAMVLSQYCDIIAIRKFPDLQNKDEDESEKILNSFIKYAEVPIVNLESSTAHPLQALADAITIREYKKNVKPKIVLSWAPHPNPLPHAVANSFVKMVKRIDAEFVITNPVGYNLNSKITHGVTVTHDQNKAFKNADFIYAKNWSSYDKYGQVITKDKNWMIDNDLMSKTNDAYFMHCLPVRRNIVVADDVLDSGKSIVIKQAQNRIYSSLVVLKRILENGK